MNWMAKVADFTAGIAPHHQARLSALPPIDIPKGTVLFRPGESATGFALVLHGRVEVNLTGPSGREIMLYAVEPGQSCVQTTLGLLGGEAYTGEAITVSDAQVISIPKPMFLEMMDHDAGFRSFVMTSFARRMHDITRLLERVAFGRVEARLAAELLMLAREAKVSATHAELAARIGTAREVVTRRLDGFTREGWVAVERGEIRVLNMDALRQLAASLG